MRLIVAVAAGCIIAGQANAQSFLLSDETKTLARAYLDCVVQESLRLGAANEAVSETVEMGKTACSARKQEIAFAVIRDANTELPKSSGETRINVAQKLREYVDEQVTQEARLQLARARSEKSNAANK